MQVNLLPLPQAASTATPAGGSLLSMLDTSSLAALRGGREDFRQQIRRAEEEDAAAATLVPTRSADVIVEAERDIDGSSRAFRRQVARETASEQFRQDRQAFRQAMTEANGQGRQTASQKPSAADTRPQPAAQNNSGDGTRADGTARGASTAPAQSARPVSPLDASQAGSPARDTTVAASRPATSAMATGTAGGSQTAGPTGILSRAAGGSPARVDGSALRVSSAAQGQAPRTAGGAGKGGGPAVAELGARGPARAVAAGKAKAPTSGPARSAEWDGNIERLVRFIRSRINGDSSRTIMRLDPPELGKLRLQMDLRGSALTLRIDAGTEVAHRLLSEDVDKLRGGLEASGIRLEQVEIRPPTQSTEASEQDARQQAGGQDGASGGSAEADAEHPGERGTDSRSAESAEGTTRGSEPVPAAESLVNVVA